LNPQSQNSGAADAGGFAATHWTVVLTAARGRESAHAEQALAELCQTYWYPLYAYLRRHGERAETAEDLTQSFIMRLLSPKFLANVDRQKGRFRAFLLASLKNFLADERDREQAQRRGGGQTIISIDGLAAEARYRLEPSDQLTPEKLFDRQWALSVLQSVLVEMQQESAAAGKSALFAAIQPTLTDRGAAPYSVIGAKLGMSEGAVKAAAYRLRQRFRELLIAHIAQTVADPNEIEDEIRDLMASL
jgi:RNA polymerase sigma-70 factor (ECF subfamily)